MTISGSRPGWPGAAGRSASQTGDRAGYELTVKCRSRRRGRDLLQLIKIRIYKTFSFHDFQEAFVGDFIQFKKIVQQLFLDQLKFISGLIIVT